MTHDRSQVILAAHLITNQLRVFLPAQEQAEQETRQEWEAKGWRWQNSTGFFYAVQARAQEIAGCGFPDSRLFGYAADFAELVAEAYPDPSKEAIPLP